MERPSFEQLIKEDRAARDSKTWRGSFLEYLDIVRDDPSVPKLAHARIFDNIMRTGTQDIHETDEEFTVELDVPGIDPGDLKIQATGDQLTIHGERRSVKDGDDKTVSHRNERITGVFERSFTLPVSVEPEQVKATYKDGVLLIRLPKAAQSRARQVTIDVQ